MQEKGNFDKWLNLVKKVRSESKIARIMMAASFASVLVKPTNSLPFFVHTWGGTETGKTVGLMFATSVWANPQMGAYIHTFNSTQVGQEVSATFVNSLPLVLDELQIIGDRKDFDKLIYTLSEGIGRTRGAKTGGLQKVGTWQNCIITSGEQPITNGSSMSGAINRIIEIDCKSEKIFKDPVHIVDIVKKNYGFAGRIFIEHLQDPTNMQIAIALQKKLYKELSNGETTEKQAMAASVILAADRLTEALFFKDDIILSVNDISDYLAKKSQVSAHERAYEFLFDYVAMNHNKFVPSEFNEIYGCTDAQYIYIIKTHFDKIMRDEGYNSAAFLSWAKEKGLLEHKPGRNTMNKKIMGEVTNCVCVKKPAQNKNIEIEQTETGDLPFD